MARRVIETLIDDLTGGTAEETLNFGLDGMQYEIDLAGKNATKLRDALAPFVKHGRRLGKTHVTRHSGRPAVTSRTTNDRTQNKAIRAWAKRKGMDVSDRGRIPQDIIDQFNSEA